MSVPRSWSRVTSQGGVVQQMAVAKPMATDGRFKSSAILLCVSLLVILANIRHILYYYKPRRYGPFSLIPSVVHYLPTRFFLNIILIAIHLAYLVASTAVGSSGLSLMKYNASPSWGFCFGYAPCLHSYPPGRHSTRGGSPEENEDKQLIRQRVERGLAADAEIGHVRKPGWWSKARGDPVARVAGNSDEAPPAGRNDAVELERPAPGRGRARAGRGVGGERGGDGRACRAAGGEVGAEGRPQEEQQQPG